MVRTTTETVQAFFDCWHRFDLDGALAFLSEDAVFRSDTKGEPVVGREAIGKLWALYMERIGDYAVDVQATASDGRVLFVERRETLVTPRGTLELPIVGVFEFDEGGRITAWRDYWDTSLAGSG